MDLRAALKLALMGAPSPAVDVLKEMVDFKRKAKKSERYLVQLEIACGMFFKKREGMPVGSLTFRDVEAFLDTKGPRSRPTLRARLATLFGFAVRRGYRPDNPCN